jgi:hypothetical protein
MATTKLSAEDRLIRRRQAARMRQQRCRARKRQALTDGQEREKPTAIVKHPFVVTSNDRSFPGIHTTLRHDQSPRSVYMREVWGPHAEFNQRFPPPIDRRRSYSYECQQQPQETRHDPVVKTHPPPPVYSHYQLPRRTFPPQFAPIQHQPHFYRYDESGQDYYPPHQAQESRQPPQTWNSPSVPQVVPPRLIEEAVGPMMSEEEAAIDAILSLKSGKNEPAVVSPAVVKRNYSQEQDESSAFRRYAQEKPIARPAVYMTVRIA